MAASEESISVMYLHSVIVNIKKFKLPVNGKLDWHERMGMFTGSSVSMSANTCLNHLKLLKLKLQNYAKDLWRRLVAVVIRLVPESFNGFHAMKYDSAIIRHNL